ncbi:MAG: hypothetical protein HUU16_08540 [Candidatus Omnitrophica bacterium]|nr:hypothetical protein [Candidatus Omnitrophota bacterium]
MKSRQSSIARPILVGLFASIAPFCLSAWGETVWFTSPDLRVPAGDLAAFLTEQTEEKIPAELAGVNPTFAQGDWVLASVSRDRTEAIERVLTPANRAFLDSSGAEGFVATNVGGIRYLLGGGQRGAAYASIRIQRLWTESDLPPLSADGEHLDQAPVFQERIGGAGGEDMTRDFAQPKPSDYDWETYARDLAHAGVNFTPGVVQGQVVPDEALKAWGIRKVLFFPSTPFAASTLREWRASNPGEIKPAEDPRASAESVTLWAPCPATEFGKKAYVDWLDKVVFDHKTLAKIVLQFTEGGAIPGEECYPKLKRPERVVAFLETLNGILKRISEDVTLYASTRGFSAEEVRAIAGALPKGVGLYFEEPSVSILDSPSGGYEPSLASLDWDAEQQRTLEGILSSRPEDCMVAVAAGDTDRLFSPAVGMALPGAAHAKIRRLQELKCRNVALAMGGIHPWVYSPNAEVFRELMWKAGESSEETLGRIAGRDFGGAAEEVLAAWSLFDQAAAALPLVCRAQGGEAFTRNGADLTTGAPVPAKVVRNEWGLSLGDGVPFLLEGYPKAIRLWREGLERLQRTQDSTEGATYSIAKNLRDGVFWSGFYLQTLETQHNVVRCLNLLKWIPEGHSAEAAPWRQAFLPLYRDELANMERWTDLLFTAPEPLLRLEDQPMSRNGLERKLDQKRQALKGLIGN